jgi:hypothetical protein
MATVVGLYYLYDTLVDYVFTKTSPSSTTRTMTTTTTHLLALDVYDGDEDDARSTRMVITETHEPIPRSFPIVDRTPWECLLNLSLIILLLIVLLMAIVLLIKIVRYHRPRFLLLFQRMPTNRLH